MVIFSSVKTAHAKPCFSWGGGDFIFVIKKSLVNRTYMIDNSLKSIGLGASFEVYNVIIRHLKHSKQIKRFA